MEPAIGKSHAHPQKLRKQSWKSSCLLEEKETSLPPPHLGTSTVTSLLHLSQVKCLDNFLSELNLVLESPTSRGRWVCALYITVASDFTFFLDLHPLLLSLGPLILSQAPCSSTQKAQLLPVLLCHLWLPLSFLYFSMEWFTCMASSSLPHTQSLNIAIFLPSESESRIVPAIATCISALAGFKQFLEFSVD